MAKTKAVGKRPTLSSSGSHRYWHVLYLTSISILWNNDDDDDELGNRINRYFLFYWKRVHVQTLDFLFFFLFVCSCYRAVYSQFFECIIEGKYDNLDWIVSVLYVGQQIQDV